MKTRKFTRRQVIATTSAGAIGTMINWPLSSFGIDIFQQGEACYYWVEKRFIREPGLNGPSGIRQPNRV